MKDGSKSRMTREHVEKVENIGFLWTPLKDIWNVRFEELQEFKDQHGHCNGVPYHCKANKALGVWVGCQRVNYRLMKEGSRSGITEEQIQKLESIGFEWSLRKKRSAGKKAVVKRSSKRLRSKK